MNGGEAILEALDLEARYRVSFWDALVIQAAQVAGAEILYSEDLSDGQRYGTVRVKNPLSVASDMEQGQSNSSAAVAEPSQRPGHSHCLVPLGTAPIP